MPFKLSKSVFWFNNTSSYSFSVYASIVYSVNFAARLILTPLLPTALSSSPSLKIATQYLLSSSMYKSIGFAGESALVIKISDLSVKLTISIFSLFNSLTIAWIRLPLIPTQAPTASILLSIEWTIILLLSPGFLAIPLISIIPSSISGTSISNNLYRNKSSLLEIIISGPLGVTSTDLIRALIVSPLLNLSEYICSVRGIRSSVCSILTKVFSLWTWWTVPITTSPILWM